jgi:hypothetical protein
MSAAGIRRAWALTLGGAWYAFLRAWEGRAKPTEEVLKFGGNRKAPYAVLTKDAAKPQKAAEVLEIFPQEPTG